MSGQTYSEMINQPAATSGDMGSALFPVLIPGTGGAAATTKLATLSQVVTEASSTIVTGQLVTSNTTPAAITGLPTILTAGGYSVLEGRIIAQNQANRVVSVWDIKLVATRTANATNCAEIAATQTIVYQDPSLTSLAITLAAGAAGPTITVTGLASTAISWGYTFLQTTGS